jgi:hypothetical protein
MGLYHSVGIAYGFEIPASTDLDRLDQVIGDGPDLVKDSVGHIVVGDYDRLLLVTRYEPVAETEVFRLSTDTLAQPEVLAAWEEALHVIALQLGHTDHAAPAWLVIHNYR